MRLRLAQQVRARNRPACRRGRAAACVHGLCHTPTLKVDRRSFDRPARTATPGSMTADRRLARRRAGHPHEVRPAEGAAPDRGAADAAASDRAVARRCSTGSSSWSGRAWTRVAAAAAPHAVVVQHERLGTAHAALQAEAHFGDGDVAVLYADNPLIRPATMRRLLARAAGGRPGAAGDAAGRAGPLRPGDRAGRRPCERDRRMGRRERGRAGRDGCATPACSAPPAADFRRWLHAVQPEPGQGRVLPDRLRGAGACARASASPRSRRRGRNCAASTPGSSWPRPRRRCSRWLRRAAMEGGATLTAPDTVHSSWDTTLGAGRHRRAARRVRARRRRSRAGRRSARSAISRAAGSGPAPSSGPMRGCGPAPCSSETSHVGNFVEVKATRMGAGRKGQPPQLLGRQRGRRADQYRRRHHHVQL